MSWLYTFSCGSCHQLEIIPLLAPWLARSKLSLCCGVEQDYLGCIDESHIKELLTTALNTGQLIYSKCARCDRPIAPDKGIVKMGLWFCSDECVRFYPIEPRMIP
jgi:hypothetical protein